MSIALVTGGNGFIGGALVSQLLARGDTVRVVGRSAYPELAARGVACFRADLADPDERALRSALAPALAGCDVVFHVAALAGVWGAFADYYRTNVLGTMRLLRADGDGGDLLLLQHKALGDRLGIRVGREEPLRIRRRFVGPLNRFFAKDDRWRRGVDELWHAGRRSSGGRATRIFCRA